MNLSRLHPVIARVAFTVAFAGTLLGQKPVPLAPAAMPDCSPLREQTLACEKLGFTYKVPFGWVDRTQEMQAASQPDAPQPKGDSDNPPPAPSTGKTLLAVFERPPGTPGGALNPAVVIAEEDRASYPQVKTAADYLGALAEIAAQRGLKIAGDPYVFPVGEKQLARADFVSTGEKAAVRQTSLVVLEKRYILSFTFLSASDDEIDELIANLTFTTGAKKAPPK